MKKPTMCPNHSCARHNEKRSVMGGCEECGTALVQWDDPDKPTIEQLAILVGTVAAFEGHTLPVEPIEEALRRSASLRQAWEIRYRETQELQSAGGGHAKNASDQQWLKLMTLIKEGDTTSSIGWPRKPGLPCIVVREREGDKDARFHIIDADGNVTTKDENY